MKYLDPHQVGPTIRTNGEEMKKAIVWHRGDTSLKECNSRTLIIFGKVVFRIHWHIGYRWQSEEVWPYKRLRLLELFGWAVPLKTYPA